MLLSLVFQMPISPQNLIELSESLFQQDSEVSWRSSVSRSYYAAYHLAKDIVSVCPDNSHFVIDSGTHGKLIDRFSSWKPDCPHRQKLGKQVAYILLDMKRSREAADYKLDMIFRKDIAAMRLKQLPLLKDLLGKIWESENQQSAS